MTPLTIPIYLRCCLGPEHRPSMPLQISGSWTLVRSIWDYWKDQPAVLVQRFLDTVPYGYSSHQDSEVGQHREQSRIEELVVHHTESNAILDPRRSPCRVPLNVCGLDSYWLSVDPHIQLTKGAPTLISSENNFTKTPFPTLLS